MAQANPGKTVKCFCCDYETGDESQLLSHVIVHRFESIYCIPCFSCSKRLISIKTYNKHAKLCPGKIQKQEISDPETQYEPFWECELCREKIAIYDREQNAKFFNKIKTHLYEHCNKGETVQCPVFKIPACEYSSSVYKSFNRYD